MAKIVSGLLASWVCDPHSLHFNICSFLYMIIDIFTKFTIDRNSWQIDIILSTQLGENEYKYSHLTNLTCVLSSLTMYSVKIWSICFQSMSFSDEFVYEYFYDHQDSETQIKTKFAIFVHQRSLAQFVQHFNLPIMTYRNNHSACAMAMAMAIAIEFLHILILKKMLIKAVVIEDNYFVCFILVKRKSDWNGQFTDQFDKCRPLHPFILLWKKLKWIIQILNA